MNHLNQTQDQANVSVQFQALASLFVVSGIISLGIYLQTLAPTITWQHNGADSGDFATAVAVGGVPHPPGYPTYITLGTIFQSIPIGDVAYRLNLLSAVSAALTVALTSLIIYRVLLIHNNEGSGPKAILIWGCALTGALTLAFAPLFWSLAVVAEVYTLNTVFIAILWYGALCLSSTNERWLLPLLSLTFGLGLGNHLTLVLILPGLPFLITVKWRWSLVITSLAAFCAGIAVYGVLVLRATALPPVNWGGATTWSNFIWLVSADLYRNYLFSLPLAMIPTRLISLGQVVTLPLMGWGVPVSLMGIQFTAQKNRRLVYGLLLPGLIMAVYAVFYNTTDSLVYLLPVLMIFALFLGWGLYHFGMHIPTLLSFQLSQAGFILGALVLIPLLSLTLNFSGQDLSDDYEALDYGQENLHLVQPNAIIITTDDYRTFGLWYVRYALAVRPDVAIVNSNLLVYPWYQNLIQHEHPHVSIFDNYGRPLISLSRFVEANLATSPLYFATHSGFTPRNFELETVGDLQHVIGPKPDGDESVENKQD
ncbi:MAG: DUF2723 domain-containing protein [Anaerolineae bacterium]|nr:DUF2723 domain-containing protein [Anaerolineae bacterium]